MDEIYREERRDFLSEAAADIDQGRYDDALALADARLRRFPGDMDAHLVRASCRALMGHAAEAEEIVSEWHAQMREQSQVYEVLGDAYRRAGMSEEAIRSYERFIDLNPGTGEARQVSERIAELENADIDGEQENNPGIVSDNFYTMTLARLYVKQGHFRMAREVIDKILERNPDHREAREYAGHIRRLIEKGWNPVIDELERWLSELRTGR